VADARKPGDLSYRVVLSTRRGLERETGLEPATFCLGSRDSLALWQRTWEPEQRVSSYRVVGRLGFGGWSPLLPPPARLVSGASGTVV
jgi:hypothetical protein